MYDVTFQAKIYPALRTAFDTLTPIWNGRLYAQVPPAGAIYPCGVYQSQDNGGSKQDAIGYNGWSGLLMFRSIARSMVESEDNLISLAGLMPSLSHTDFDISSVADITVHLPIGEDSLGKIYTSGQIYRIAVYPKT